MTVAPSTHDVEHIDAIMGGQGDWFSARLLRLFGKADSQNRLLLAVIYPAHHKLFMDWYLDQEVPGVPE